MDQRIIKFRFWIKEIKGFNYVVFEHGRINLEAVQDFNKWAQDRIWDWQQFTGLLDKNGKEIYEGDIVRGKDCGGHENIEPVEYRDCAFRPLGIDQGCGDTEMRDPEVIGNIYENPELLK